MPAVRRTPFLRFMWRAHRAVFGATGGRIGGRMFGWEVILLETTGHQSGQPRRVMLNALSDRGRWVVIASYAGEPRHPAWYRNLEKMASAAVLSKGVWTPVAASTAKGEERNRLWRTVVAKDPSYAEYADRVERQIPVVILEPQPSEEYR